MKKIDSVIKVKRWNLDEKKTKLNNLKNLLSHFLQQQQMIEEEYQNEKLKVGDSPAVSQDFQNYIKLIEDRKATIEDSITSVSEQVKEAEREILQAFQELKKFELIDETEKRKLAEELKQEEQKFLDESSTLQFVRKRESETV